MKERPKLCCIKPSRSPGFDAVILDVEHEAVAWFEKWEIAEEFLHAWEKVHGDGAGYLDHDECATDYWSLPDGKKVER